MQARRIPYRELLNPPSSIRRSKNIRSDVYIEWEDSTYVLEDSSDGLKKALELANSIIDYELELKTGLERRYGETCAELSRCPDFGSPEHRKRVERRLEEAFVNGGDFHMKIDLENTLIRDLYSTNLPSSRFRKEGGVVFFDLWYFSPSEERKKEEIEGRLRLERKIHSVVKRTEYSRTGKGVYFRIPYKSDLVRMFGFLETRHDLDKEVEQSMRGWRNSYILNLIDPRSRNLYEFALNINNIDMDWKGHIKAIEGELFGAAVAEDVCLPMRARRSDFEEWLEYMRGNSSEGWRFGNLSDEERERLFREFRESRTGFLKDHLRNLRKKDREYGVHNKVVTSVHGANHYLYLENPVLEMRLSLLEARDYKAVKDYMERFPF